MRKKYIDEMKKGFADGWKTAHKLLFPSIVNMCIAAGVLMWAILFFAYVRGIVSGEIAFDISAVRVLVGLPAGLFVIGVLIHNLLYEWSDRLFRWSLYAIGVVMILRFIPE